MVVAVTVSFEIPGAPYAKKRPRFNRRTGHAHDPRENRTFEQTVAAIAMQHFPEALTCPVSIEVVAVFEPPRSWSGAKAKRHLGQPHVQKPDGDNLLKAVLDGLNRVAFSDDKQVYDMRVRKFWGPRAKTVVHVDGMEDD